MSAHGDVADASVQSPAPGQVLVTILSNDGNGAAPESLLAAVSAALNAEDVRPLTDEVIVQGATIVPYTIEAQLTLYPGPAPNPVLASAQAAAVAYAAQTHRLGYDVTLSGIYAALHQAGVQRVALTSPAADLVIDLPAASYCANISITLAGATDV
jgi:phage-related baseplate assembly protein